jgi:hypothetical protein
MNNIKQAETNSKSTREAFFPYIKNMPSKNITDLERINKRKRKLVILKRQAKKILQE